MTALESNILDWTVLDLDYARIAKILAAPKNIDRIYALLMLDGLHVA